MAKRIPYKIIDLEALQKAYPEIVSEETIITKTVNLAKLYKIVKLSAELGRTIDGVEIGADEPVSAEPVAEIPTFLKGKE